MNDEQAVRRGQEAARALQYLAPVLDDLSAKAMTDLLEAGPEDVLAAQLYAKALSAVRKTIEGHIRAGEFVTAARA